jgi:hypothetical protein
LNGRVVEADEEKAESKCSVLAVLSNDGIQLDRRQCRKPAAAQPRLQGLEQPAGLAIRSSTKR